MDGARILLYFAPRGSGREKFTGAGTIAELVQAQRELGDRNRAAIFRVLQEAPEALSTDQVRQGARQREHLELEHMETVQRHCEPS